MKIKLLPQGSIGRNLGLTVYMQKAGGVAGAAGAIEACSLEIVMPPVIGPGAANYFVVFASEVQLEDLDVTVSLVDPGTPPALQFYTSVGSPVSVGTTVVATILAGMDYVIIPVLAGAAQVDPVTVSAVSELCGSATADVLVQENSIVYPIVDILILVKSEQWIPVPQDGTGGYTVGQGVTSDSRGAALFGTQFPRTNATSYSIHAGAINHTGSGYNTQLVTISARVQLLPGVYMDPERITWDLTPSGGNTSFIEGTGAFGTVFITTTPGRLAGLEMTYNVFGPWLAPPNWIDAGHSFVLTCFIDGAPVALPRSAFTVNIIV